MWGFPLPSTFWENSSCLLLPGFLSLASPPLPSSFLTCSLMVCVRNCIFCIRISGNRNRSMIKQIHISTIQSFFFFFTLPTSHLAKKQTFGPLLQQQVFPGRWLACSFACILGRHLLPWVIFWSVLVLPRSKLFTWVLNSSKQTLSPFRKDHAFIPWSLLGAQGRRMGMIFSMGCKPCVCQHRSIFYSDLSNGTRAALCQSCHPNRCEIEPKPLLPPLSKDASFHNPYKFDHWSILLEFLLQLKNTFICFISLNCF